MEKRYDTPIEDIMERARNDKSLTFKLWVLDKTSPRYNEATHELV